MKRLHWVLWWLLLVLTLPMAAGAEESKNLSGVELVSDSRGFGELGFLFDGEESYGRASEEEASLTLKHPEGIGSVYLIFDLEYGPYTVTNGDTGETKPWGAQGFVHDFLDLEALFGTAPSSVTLDFPNGKVNLCELYAFSPGQVPGFVQQWEPPSQGQTDLALFSTHGDDEQIFFAGMLPYYAGELGYQVQVVYLTDHRNMTRVRVHEMLNGLWNVGVSSYPVFGRFDDFLTYDREEAYQIFERLGYPRETLLSFVVEQLRRFRPLVAVGHDFKGEYGHGQHMVYADLLSKAVELSADASAFPESAGQYGLWEVPKTYFHLYQEGAITLDWDLPLERFGGLTAFEVTKERGFPCHATQQYPVFRRQLYSFSTAAAVDKYNPCAFGLYRSAVGEDAERNDFFENLVTYGQQRRMEQERLDREEERLRIDAIRERRRQTRLEARRLAAVRREIEEAEQTAVKKQSRVTLWVGAVGTVALGGLLWRALRSRGKKGPISF